MMKENKGITLVALVITIIILLILAGISIVALKENGLLEKAQLAKEKSENEQIKEEEILEKYENNINGYVNGTRDTYTFTEEELNKYIQQKLNEEYLYYTFEVSFSGQGQKDFHYKDYFKIPDLNTYQYLNTTWTFTGGSLYSVCNIVSPKEDMIYTYLSNNSASATLKVTVCYKKIR